jgi:hypothetical protein
MKPGIQRFLICLAFLVLAVGIAVFSQRVFATHFPECPPGSRNFDRCYFDGYFTGVTQSASPAEGTFIWPDGLTAVNNAEEFIAITQPRLNTDLSGCPLDPTTTISESCRARKQLAVGAAAIVNMMMGRNGTEFTGVPDGIAQAQAIFPEWAERVQYYDDQGWVEWDIARTIPEFQEDFYGSAYSRDVFWGGLPGTSVERVTVFHNPDGTEFTFLRKCANPNGKIQPLQTPGNYNNVPNLGTLDPPVVQPGDVIDLLGSVNNIGDGDSPQITLTATNANTTHFTSTYSNGGVPLAGGYRWVTTGPTAGTTLTGFNYGFRVEPSAPDGGVFCFEFRVTPAGGQTGPPPTVDQAQQVAVRCFTVRSPRHPFFDTEGGDVHAGASFNPVPCLVPPIAGGATVTGTTDGASIGSKADYVVSASGLVVDSGSGNLRRRFGSSGNPAGDQLTFGNSGPLGSYGEVCRPDLATKFLNEPGGFVGAVTNVNALSNNSINKHNGSVTLSGGNLNNGDHKTLVVNGNVYITGNITRSTSGYVNKSAIPSFALIATGNIYIHPSVTELYGVFYAGTATNRGEINTCSLNGSGPSIVAAGGAATCSQSLQVNGMLFGSQIVLRRTRSGVDPFVSPREAAETVSFQPGMLISPPPGLSSLFNQINFSGELPPVY